MPFGNEVVVKVSGVVAATIVIVIGPEVIPIGLLESVALTVSAWAPAVVGMPLTTQPFNVKPAGSVPAVKTQL